MAKSLEDINKEYTQVAAQLGDMAFKKLDLEDAWRHVEQQIDELDKSMGELRLTRNALMKAAGELQAAAVAPNSNTAASKIDTNGTATPNQSSPTKALLDSVG